MSGPTGTIPVAALFPQTSAPSTPGITPTTTSTSSSLTSSKPSTDQSFDFTVPSLPPRLANFGRKISQMGSDIYNEINSDSDQTIPPRSMPVTTRSVSSNPSSQKQQPSRSQSHDTHPVVPGMGDDPVMCPFCNKPLPPMLFTNHAHTPVNHNPVVPKRNTAVQALGHGHAHVGTSSGLTRSMSARPSMTRLPSSSSDVRPILPTQRSQTKSHTDLPSTARITPNSTTPKVEPEVIPKATSTSLEPVVKEADQANSSAAQVIISKEDVKRWSQLAGMTPPILPEEEVEVKESVEKVVPKIAPPPSAPGHRPRSSASAKFGFFSAGNSRETSRERSAGGGDEDSDDEDVGKSGYAKVGAGSDSDDEVGEKKVSAKPTEKAKEASVASRSASPVIKEVQPEPAPKQEDDEMRKLLRHVLGKVNEISASHSALLMSHSSILTSLKIARSNLAMAEANTEMLEADLKRLKLAQPLPPASQAQTLPVSQPPSRATTPNASQPPSARQSVDQPRPLPTNIPNTSSPSTIQRQVSDSTSNSTIAAPRARPMSLQMPSNVRSGSQPPSSTGAPGEKSSWQFWNGGKKKLPGGLGTVTIPTVEQIRSALPTPVNELGGFDFDFTPSSLSPTVEKRNPSTGTSLNQNSMSTSTTTTSSPLHRPQPPSQTQTQNQTHPGISRSNSLATSSATTNPSGQPMTYTQLRQAYITSNTRFERMSKELAELKQGKVDMEAELENLSQALFEEANKMVRDERRRVGELEESLKEVRAEREVLRETVKVLGGSVGVEGVEEGIGKEEEEEGGGDVKEKGEGKGEGKVGFEPRDLDKHYEALKRAVHHVGDSGPSTPTVDIGLADEGKLEFAKQPIGIILPSNSISTVANPVIHYEEPESGEDGLGRVSLDGGRDSLSGGRDSSVGGVGDRMDGGGVKRGNEVPSMSVSMPSISTLSMPVLGGPVGGFSGVGPAQVEVNPWATGEGVTLIPDMRVAGEGELGRTGGYPKDLNVIREGFGELESVKE